MSVQNATESALKVAGAQNVTGSTTRVYIVMTAVNSSSTNNLTVLVKKGAPYPPPASLGGAAAPSGSADSNGGFNTVETVGGNNLNSLQDLLSVFGNNFSDAAIAKAARIGFWAAVAFAAVLVLHTILILALRARGKRPPELLDFPRLELFAMLLLIQPVGQSAASLVAARTPATMAGGVLLFVLFCMGFIAGGTWVVWQNVHRADRRKAQWVVPQIQDEAKPKRWYGKVWEWCVARPLAGPPKPEALWVATDDAANLQFLRRNGIFFEDNEGPPHMYVRSTEAEAADAAGAAALAEKVVEPSEDSGEQMDTPVKGTGGRQLGSLQPMPQRVWLRFGQHTLTAADLRTYATLLWVGKAAVIGYVSVSITTKGGPGGVIAVVCAGVLWLAYLWLLAPLRERLEQGVVVVSAIMDCICFIGALILLLLPTSSVQFNITVGYLMIMSQGGATWLWIASRPWSFWPILKLSIGPRIRIFMTAAGMFRPTPGAGTAAASAGTPGQTTPQPKLGWSASLFMRAAAATTPATAAVSGGAGPSPRKPSFIGRTFSFFVRQEAAADAEIQADQGAGAADSGTQPSPRRKPSFMERTMSFFTRQEAAAEAELSAEQAGHAPARPATAADGLTREGIRDVLRAANVEPQRLGGAAGILNGGPFASEQLQSQRPGRSWRAAGGAVLAAGALGRRRSSGSGPLLPTLSPQASLEGAGSGRRPLPSFKEEDFEEAIAAMQATTPEGSRRPSRLGRGSWDDGATTSLHDDEAGPSHPVNPLLLR